MTTREKSLAIAKDIIKYLKELKKLRVKNFQLDRNSVLKKKKDEESVKKDTIENRVKNVYNENINNKKFYLSVLEDWTGLTACIERVSKKTLIVAIVVYYKYYEIPGISQWSCKKYKHLLVQTENTEQDFVKLILNVYEKTKEECVEVAYDMKISI